MNNNRGNNRRRGRGNNRQQGHQQLNRVDSRARGNAPQMLEKYRKLAHDAHLNGDRVQEEYYLQYADHYFRVIADQKQRQDETRQKRDDRSPDGSDNDRNQSDRDSDDYNDSDEDSYRDKPQARQNNRSSAETGDERDAQEQAELDAEENPFVRDSRPAREVKPRKPRRTARSKDSDTASADSKAPTEAGGVDPSVLPPAISTSSSDDTPADKAEAPAKPKRRARRPRTDSDGGETLEAVS